MIEKYKKTSSSLSYFENLIIFVSTFSGCVSISVFASFVGFL